MEIFKKKDQDIYLITNFKVMFSTLKNQDNLINVSPNKRLFIHALSSWYRSESKFYLLVRNPFKRTISFYKSKFLKADENRKNMLRRGDGKWQVCTEHFFPYLGLTTHSDPLVVSKTLTSTKFETVISILPEVFKRDGHMHPQYYAQRIKFKKDSYRFPLPYRVKSRIKLPVPIRFKKIFKMENKHDLREIEQIFGVDLSIRKNPTGHIEDNIKWDDVTIRTVLNIYKKDFKNFNYKQIPEGHTNNHTE